MKFTKMKFTKLIAACAAFASMLAVAETPAVAKDYKSEYKLSTVLARPSPWGVGAERWAELVTERTQGRITVRVFPGPSLVGGNQTMEFGALRQGAIDMSVSGTNNWSSQVKELSLFGLPFLIPNAAAMDALTGGEVGAYMFKVLETKGAIGLAWGDNGFREWSNSKRPIRTPEDMKGLKMRSVGSPILLDTFTALGANPTQMSWSDALPALSTGAVDGQENAVSIFASAKLQTMGQKYMTLSHYIASPLIFAVNRDVWNSWSPADRDIVKQAALDAAKENITQARTGTSTSKDAVLQQLAAEGVETIDLTAAERKAFRDAVQSVYDKWSPIIGSDLVAKAQAVAAKY